MSGPEHYRKAERLLQRRITGSLGPGKPTTNPPMPESVAQAQVHAILALAAATAMTGLPITPQERQAWWDMGSANDRGE